VQETVAPIVSVIVSSHREGYIHGLVSAFTEKVIQKVPTEIIIVADYPIDHLKKKYPHIQWLYVPDKNISKKRNVGINNATGVYCAFIDDDCRPGDEWIPRAVSFLESNPDMAGVEGLTVIVTDDVKAGAYKEFKRLEEPGYRTNNIFYRRRLLLSVNMFDERFTVQREDVDLAYSFIEAGYAIGYSKEITVSHQLRKNEKWDLLKNCVNRRFDPLLFRKHKQLYRKHIRMPYPPGILSLFVAHALCIGGIISQSKLLLLFLITDFVLLVILTVRRSGLPWQAHGLQWFRDCAAFIVSPFVLFGALVYGSTRFRSLFLI